LIINIYKMKTQTTQNKIHANHSFMIILCCLIPLIIAGALFYFGLKNYAIFAVMLLCPDSYSISRGWIGNIFCR